MPDSTCEVEMPELTKMVKALKDALVAFLFPSVDYEVRSDVIKYLSDREDTAYGVSVGIMKPLPSVVKALKDLERLGYVTREERESPRRKGKASVYRLSKAGRLAAYVLLLPDVDLPQINLDKLGTVLRDTMGCTDSQQAKDVVVKWLNNSSLRRILSILAPFHLPHYIGEYSTEILFLDDDTVDEALATAIIHTIIQLLGLMANVMRVEVKESNIRGEKLKRILDFADTTLIRPRSGPSIVTMEDFAEYSQFIKRLLQCAETRSILAETVKVWLACVKKLLTNTILVLQAMSLCLELGDLNLVEERIAQLYNERAKEGTY